MDRGVPGDEPFGQVMSQRWPTMRRPATWCSLAARVATAAAALWATPGYGMGARGPKQVPATSPPARESATMAYDAATGNVVLFGGMPSSSSYMCEHLFERHLGMEWKHMDRGIPGGEPAGQDWRHDGLRRGRLATWCSLAASGSGNALNDTWVWNGSTWTEEFPATSPPARYRGHDGLRRGDRRRGALWRRG